MFRLLVVEDQVDFYQDYLLRLFSRLLPMEKVSVTHAPNLEAALVALRDPWNAVLMDYSLGTRTEFLGDPVRDGSDLVRFRRAIEALTGQPKAYILGMASSKVSNKRLQETGADTSLLKLQVVDMAKLLAGMIQG